MAIAFNRLLIPVDFSPNTDVAVKRAAELAGKAGSELHLLHVVRPGAGGREVELGVLEEAVRLKYPFMTVKKHVLRGRSVQGMIIACAGLLRPDLVIIAKSDTRRRWNLFGRPFLSGGVLPDVIARKSDCPVLTVKPGSVESKPRVILIPIRDTLPERKLEWAVLLAKKYRAQVHLLAIHERQEKEWALPQVFLKAYHQLREHLHHPIEYSASGRQSAAKAALNCAESIMADVIVLNAETESGVAGLTGYRHISDLLGKDSKIQVLEVMPYNSELQN